MREIDRQDLMDSDHIAQLRQRVIQSNTFLEYLQLAEDIFDIHQIDSEIIGLIEKVREYKPTTIGEIGTFKFGSLFVSLSPHIVVDVLAINPHFGDDAMVASPHRV